jgi:hypothetical protein
MADKPAGKTFNIKEPGAPKGDGKKEWTQHGRAFVRLDWTGGAVWMGSGEQEREYVLLPREGTTKSAGKSFDVMERVEGDGKTLLKRFARIFVRATMKGGAMWLGDGENEVEYALFSSERKAKPVSPTNGPSDSAEAPAPA